MTNDASSSTSSSTLRRLTRLDDIDLLLNDLREDDDVFSLPVRFLPFCLRNGVLNNVFVIANDWPDWQIIFCAHDSAEYLQADEGANQTFLFATLYQRKGRCLDKQHVRAFLSKLNETLGLATRGFDLCGVSHCLRRLLTEAIAESRQDNFSGLHGSNSLSFCDEIFRDKPFELIGFKKSDGELTNLQLPCLDPNYKLDVLRPEDTATVLKHWGSSRFIQQNAKRLPWLVSKFPSACIRSDDGIPIAWVLTYEFGACGAQYSSPEHRNKGYGRLVVYHILRRFLEQFPGQQLWSIAEPTNTAEKRSVAPLRDEAAGKSEPVWVLVVKHGS